MKMYVLSRAFLVCDSKLYFILWMVGSRVWISPKRLILIYICALETGKDYFCIVWFDLAVGWGGEA